MKPLSEEKLERRRAYDRERNRLVRNRRPSDIHIQLYKAIRKNCGLLPRQVARHLNLTLYSYTRNIEDRGWITVANFRKLVEFLQIDLLDVIRLLRLLPPYLTWAEISEFQARCQEKGQVPGMILAEFVKVYGRK